MPYAKQTWADGPAGNTPVSATRLSHIEDGIDAAVPKDLVDAKGDLFVGTADNTVGRLPVGSNGAQLVADSTQTSGMRWSSVFTLSGSGFPEGVVTAPVGSRYVDTVATNGAVEWVKASGIGNTGWRVVSGDTGWRNITGSLPAAMTAGAILLRRINATVFCKLDAVVWAAGTSPLNVIPAGLSVGSGFSPSPNSNHRAVFEVSDADLVNTDKLVAYLSASSIFIRLMWRDTSTAKITAIPNDGKVKYGQTSWLTDVSWPATLPGIAA